MSLDSRTWLVWGIAASFPALVSRNPFLLVELLVIVLMIRMLVHVPGEWNWIIRIATVFAAISILFNVLTVHSGDKVISSLPSGWPIVGGDLTWNALIYGAVSGVAILLMVLIWTLVAAHLHWTELLHHVPGKLAPLAVAGSVAWSYLPRMQETLQDIRESQRSRGYQENRVRDLPAIIVPLLAGGLERALMTAEVLETRGFGGSPVSRRGLAPALRLVAGLVLLTTAAYCLMTGQVWAAIILAGSGGVLLLLEFRQQPETSPVTRFRITRLSRYDRFCLIACGGSMILLIVRLAINDTAFAFNPYPELSMPLADPVALASLLLLFVPACVNVATSGVTS
jgi:energy-coupling factor transport system permease protein